MIVSALLTSVGINLALCILLIALYSILRKQPSNLKVYAPRLLAEGKIQKRSRFNIENLLPSTGWVGAAWRVSEEELLGLSGLDGVVFIRIFVFSLKVFSIAGIIGIFVLLPVNYLGDQLRDIDFSDISNKSIDLFSISNVKDSSNRLWLHFSAAYLMTGIVCYLLYIEYKYIYIKRLEHFNKSKPEPHHFTILVRGIPARDGSTLNDSVERFFMEFHPSTYFSHIVVHRTGKLRTLIADTKNMYRRLTRLKSTTDTSQSNRRRGFLGFFGKRVNCVDDHAKKLEDLEANLRIEQSSISMAGEEVPAAFVCFRSRYGAAAACHIQQSINPTQWVTEQAPEPHDVYWPFFSTSFITRWISKLVVIVASIILIVVFLIPVSFVQGLTYLEQLETLFPFLKNILEISIVSQIITGYLPSLILQLFLSFVPPIMKIFSSMQGHISVSEIEKSACSKMLWFTIWNVFFANVLTGSVASQVQIFLDPKNIPSVLAVVVPAQASFFIAFVVTSWTGLSSELTSLMRLIRGWICCNCMDDDEFDPPSIPYHSEIPRFLLIGLLGLTYFLLSPIILPFILLFFCIGYVVYRNQLLNVYMPKYDTAGKFWPIVHSSTIFSLVLMQIIAIGIFGLKKLPLASGLILPLPVFTLLFNEYCRKRFLPIFIAYPAESLIKKDREEQNDPAMGEFFRKLVTAYRDPALMPIEHTLNLNEHNSPLLSSS